MANKIHQGNVSVTHPYVKAFAVTPNDTADITTNSRALYVGTTGSLAVIFESDSTSVTLTAVPVGVHPFAVRRVLATGTSASNIVALY